jgi:hypothetical protein
MAVANRQLRVRVLEALESRARQFRAREELWPLRVPPEPVALEDVVAQALGDEAWRFDTRTLRSRTLLHLEWAGGSAWDAWVAVLPSNLKLYCDGDDRESRILASGGRNEGDESDRAFLTLLAESGGGHFGIEMAGGPPARVRSSMNRAFLVDVFVELFEVTGAEAAVRDALARLEPGRVPEHPPEGADFRAEVERWFDHTSGHTA